MESQNKPVVDVLIYFQLDMPLSQLRNIFAGVENFSDLLGERRITQIAPGISFGPPSVAISQYKSTRIEYFGDRFLLQQSGPVTELIELNDVAPSLFEKQKYSLGETVRFCEFNSRMNPLVGKGVVDWIRANVKVNLEGLSKACGEDLKPFAFWASNLDTPLADKWLNIILQPDVNSPHDRLFWNIVKRTKTHQELSEFLKRVNLIIQDLGKMFGT
jgi:hypothetical protein